MRSGFQNVSLLCRRVMVYVFIDLAFSLIIITNSNFRATYF